MQKNCKICGAETHLLLQRKVLGKYDGTYHQCNHCGFLQIFEHPWLAESYSSAITSLDIGLVQRNLDYAPRVKALIDLLLKPRSGKYLDYGGGYGLFVRMMRDRGFDFYRYDTYCDNLFAASFDYHLTPAITEKFDLVTAFEVFEHITDPMAELAQMTALSEAVFFSTELQPEGEEALQKWWYLLPEIGQHISFYSRKSLEYMAQKAGYHLYTDGKYFHLFTKQKISAALFALITKKESFFHALVFKRWQKVFAGGRLPETDEGANRRTLSCYDYPVRSSGLYHPALWRHQPLLLSFDKRVSKLRQSNLQLRHLSPTNCFGGG